MTEWRTATDGTQDGAPAGVLHAYDRETGRSACGSGLAAAPGREATLWPELPFADAKGDDRCPDCVAIADI